MPRKARNFKREVLPDPLYGSVLVSVFINKVMLDGKKSIAENLVYRCIDILDAKSEQSGVEIFESGVRAVAPLMEVKSRRVGGSTYQVPIEVKRERGLALAMRWIIKNSRSRKGLPMADKLASELWDAFNGVGASIKNRDESHKSAEANKPFAHLRW